MVSLAPGQNVKLAWQVAWNHRRIYSGSEASQVVVKQIRQAMMQ